MATISKIKNKTGITYRAQIRRFAEGKPVYSEAKTFPKRAMAEKWAARREQELDEPGAIASTKLSALTVGDLIRKYQTEFCAKAGRTKKADIKSLLNYELAEVALDGLTSEILINHVRQRLLRVKPQTVVNDLVWLRNVFKAAYPAWGIRVDETEIAAATNFCRSKGMIHKSDSRKRRPTEKEINLLTGYFLARNDRSDIPMLDIMNFAISSGRRQAEITALLWADNDDKHQTGMVRDLKHPRKKKGNNKRFKYTPEAWEIVQRQPKTSPFIFPYNPKTIGSIFTDACKLLEIENLRFHDLRHEATSRLFEAGYSIPQVQLFTLHESWEVLRRYVNLRPEDVGLPASHQKTS